MSSPLQSRLRNAEQALERIEAQHSPPRGIAELLREARARHERGEAEAPQFLNLGDFSLADQKLARRINAARMQCGLIPTT